MKTDYNAAIYRPQKTETPKVKKSFNEDSVDFVKDEVMENIYYWSDIQATNTDKRLVKLKNFPKRNKKGEVIQGVNTPNVIEDPKIKLVARTSVNKEHNTVQHYVLVEGGELYNPNEISVRYNKRNWKLVLVKDNTIMDLYLAFLGFGSPNSKNSVACKKKAERLL